MNHSKGCCDDAMSSDMLCSSDLWGVYDESFERALRRRDVVRHAMLFRVYDESFERVLRRCDVVKHAMLFRFWGFTLNHSKGSCGDARSLR